MDTEDYRDLHTQDWGHDDSDLEFYPINTTEHTGYLYTRALPSTEEWTCDWGTELSDLWRLVRDACESRGWPFFDKIGFPEFAELAYGHSTLAPNV